MNPEGHAWRALLPECCQCGRLIEEETCYQVNGEAVCEGCMEEMRIYTTDLMG